MTKRPTRMEQIGNLMTAMITVIVSGGCNLFQDEDEISAATLRKIDHWEFWRGGRYFGVQSRVASQLQVSQSYVAHVFNGTMQSRRVQDALISEIKLIDANLRDPGPLDSLTIGERVHFKNGGKYRHIFSSVASSFGVQRKYVWHVGMGRSKSKRIMTAIRAEMARVDAELDSKSGGKA